MSNPATEKPPVPPTSFRLRESELLDLDELAEQMKVSRTDCIRALIAWERDRRGLGQAAATQFIERLHAIYGPDAALEVFIEYGAVADLTIGGRPTGQEVGVMLIYNTRDASVRLEGDGVSLQLADIPIGDAEGTYRLSMPIRGLSPRMARL
jgi:hypothetical protein